MRGRCFGGRRRGSATRSPAMRGARAARARGKARRTRTWTWTSSRRRSPPRLRGVTASERPLMTTWMEFRPERDEPTPPTARRAPSLAKPIQFRQRPRQSRGAPERTGATIWCGDRERHERFEPQERPERLVSIRGATRVPTAPTPDSREASNRTKTLISFPPPPPPPTDSRAPPAPPSSRRSAPSACP